MKRIYVNDVHDNITFFTGIEVEHTPAIGLKTLFVVGVQNSEMISYHAKTQNVDHIYLGANQSFDPGNWQDGGSSESEAWYAMINQVLDLGYLTTLDFDVKHVEWVCDGGYSEKNNFIPQISVKIPYIQLLGYNATLKIDDKDFDATNPGVWCHQLHDLQSRTAFTDWTRYKKDEPL